MSDAELRYRVFLHDKQARDDWLDPLWFSITSLADWIELEFPERPAGKCLGPGDVESLREAGRRLRNVQTMLEALDAREKEIQSKRDRFVVENNHPAVRALGAELCGLREAMAIVGRAVKKGGDNE